MTIHFLLFLAVLDLLMKFTTLLIRDRSTGSKWLFWFMPFPSASSLPRCRPLGDLRSTLGHAVLSAGVLAWSASAQSDSSANWALASRLASQCKRSRSVKPLVDAVEVNMHGITTSTRCSAGIPVAKSILSMGRTRVDSAIKR